MPSSHHNRLRLAPMMGYTNAPFRLLLRLISPSCQLFTEMLTVNAVRHNFQSRYFFRFAIENNVVLQLAGAEVEPMVKVACLARDWGFKEININCGCPSNRVLNGRFGACLMAQPELVAKMIMAIKQATSLRVSIKHRLGLNQDHSYQPLLEFATACTQAGADSLIVHARNAWIKGLSPRQNRHRPKLNPERVKQLKKDLPDIDICINGEIQTLDEIDHYLKSAYADAVMIGRYGWHNPCFFHQVEQYLGSYSQQTRSIQRCSLVAQYFDCLNQQLPMPVGSCRYWLKPLVNLYHGQPGAKIWRQKISSVEGSDYINQITALARQLDQSEPL